MKNICWDENKPKCYTKMKRIASMTLSKKEKIYRQVTPLLIIMLMYLMCWYFINYFLDKRGCNGTYDQIACFEAAPLNTTLKIPCPEMPGVFDTTSNIRELLELFDKLFWNTFLFKNSYTKHVWIIACGKAMKLPTSHTATQTTTRVWQILALNMPTT